MPPEGYELVWNGGDALRKMNDFERLTETTDMNFYVKEAKPCSTYKFALRAKNACGVGPFSEPVTVFSESGP